MTLSRRVPGASLVHPISLSCLVVLVMNDHFLKRAWPGVVSGKLSDFAGVLLLPLFLHACFELGQAALTRRPLEASRSNRALALALALTAVVFSAAKLGGAGDTFYRYGLGALQWPLRVVWAALQGLPAPPFTPVSSVVDPTDLSALPMLFVAHRIASRRASPNNRRNVRGKVAAGVFALLLLPGTAAAAERTHDGFYLNFKLGPAALFLDSTASISNGFQQRIDSSARGMLPAGALEIGGTIPRVPLVLGVRIGLARAFEPRISTLGESFRIRNFALKLTEFEVVARYFPDPTAGLHFGGGVGAFSIERDGGYDRGKSQRGLCMSVEAGHYFWVARQWSLGVDANLFVGRASGDDFGRTIVVMPMLSGAVVLH